MKRRAKIIIGIGTVFLAVLLIPVIHHYQLRAEVNDYIAELKAKGELLDLAQVIPPPVPPEQNDAPSFLKAVSIIEKNLNNRDCQILANNPPPTMRMVAPGKAMIGWEQPDIRNTDGTNSWEDIQAALDKENDALDSLQQITSHPELDFNLNYAGGFANIRFSDLSSLKRAAQLLSASTIFDLHQGDTASAVKATHSMLLLANATQHDRMVISELVRMAIAQMGSTATWEILQSTNVTDDQLAELQQDWAKFDFIGSEENALLMERTIGQISLAQQRNAGMRSYLDREANARKLEGLDSGEESIWGQMKIKTKVFIWRYWWSYTDELRSLKGYDAIINAVTDAQTNAALHDVLEIQNKKLDELGISKIDGDTFAFNQKLNFHALLSQSIVSLGAFTRKMMYADAAKQVTMTAIALKRYHLKNGSYPTGLDRLVPEFLPEVPLDPVDGQSLGYRLNMDGSYLLYSVGENGKDDGGSPSLQPGVKSSNLYWESNIALDWVWPQPATPEEVQKYYANLGKQN